MAAFYLESGRVSPWMITHTGRRVDLLDPQPDQIDIEDIATHLSRLARFTGATVAQYNVAQHSVLVSRCCPRHPLAGLLHDAHEAYLGDISRPVKELLDLAGAQEFFRDVTRNLDRVIARKFGLQADALWSEEVKHADDTLLATEKRDLVVPHTHAWSYPLPPPLKGKLRAETDWSFTRVQFLRRFKELTEE